MSEWVDRTTALDRMGVKAQTLYAYVSRGLVEVRADASDPRRSLYRASDIAGLADRRARGRRPTAIAASTIAWGEPVITTAIATVHRERLIYRGVDAVEFAGSASLEDTAALLWDSAGPVIFATRSTQAADPDPFLTLAALTGAALPMMGRKAAKVQGDAAAAIGALAVTLGAQPGEAPVHQRLATAWSLDSQGADRIRRVLVLLADHELNASTFAVRVTASTGASMAACLLAGLSALSGPRHGTASTSVIAVLEEVRRVGVDAAIANWLSRYREVPSFGHPLYPNGDPRARAILDGLPPDDELLALQAAVDRIVGSQANVDFALAALVRAESLPKDAGFRLFALGRSVGWAAHAMEQVATGQLIRPRATYTGASPTFVR